VHSVTTEFYAANLGVTLGLHEKSESDIALTDARTLPSIAI